MIDRNFLNCWIKPNGRVLIVNHTEHEKGFTQEEIKYNESHWLKISNGNPINFEVKIFEDWYSNEIDAKSSRCKVTQAQKNKYLLINETDSEAEQKETKSLEHIEGKEKEE